MDREREGKDELGKGGMRWRRKGWEGEGRDGEREGRDEMEKEGMGRGKEGNGDRGRSSTFTAIGVYGFS